MRHGGCFGGVFVIFVYLFYLYSAPQGGYRITFFKSQQKALNVINAQLLFGSRVLIK